MQISVALLFAVVTSVHAFGVLPVLRPRAAAATAFHLRPFRLMSAQDSAGYTRQNPDYELACVVEDDEWMRLTIQLTQAVYGQVKGRVLGIMEEDQVNVQTLEDAGLDIERFVRVRIPFNLHFSLHGLPRLLTFCNLPLCLGGGDQASDGISFGGRTDSAHERFGC